MKLYKEEIIDMWWVSRKQVGKRSNGDINKNSARVYTNLRERNVKAETVITTQMWKIDDPLELAVSIIRYVTVYGVEQVSVWLFSQLSCKKYYYLSWRMVWRIL